MSPQPLKRLYKAATGAALRRDQIEMESIDRLLSPWAPARAPRPMEAAAIRRIANAGFRSILCPVDFSPQSRIALRYAAALATRSHGRLSILYVNDPLLVAAAGIALHDRTLATRNLAELRRLVESTVSPAVLEPARLDDAVTSGTPADEIVKTAKRRRCDLIVMGTHGLTGADKLLIGSTTCGVLQRTSVPVLAIPAGPGTQSRVGGRTIMAGQADHRRDRDGSPCDGSRTSGRRSRPLVGIGVCCWSTWCRNSRPLPGYARDSARPIARASPTRSHVWTRSRLPFASRWRSRRACCSATHAAKSPRSPRPNGRAW